MKLSAIDNVSILRTLKQSVSSKTLCRFITENILLNFNQQSSFLPVTVVAFDKIAQWFLWRNEISFPVEIKIYRFSNRINKSLLFYFPIFNFLILNFVIFNLSFLVFSFLKTLNAHEFCIIVRSRSFLLVIINVPKDMSDRK